VGGGGGGGGGNEYARLHPFSSSSIKIVQTMLQKEEIYILGNNKMELSLSLLSSFFFFS